MLYPSIYIYLNDTRISVYYAYYIYYTVSGPNDYSHASSCLSNARLQGMHILSIIGSVYNTPTFICYIYYMCCICGNIYCVYTIIVYILYVHYSKLHADLYTSVFYTHIQAVYTIAQLPPEVSKDISII